ncbi:hypothetical protein Q8F55_004031 [Vanrija albida]|uniref:Potassium transport protein n=1 Tax=Vanrija albida TaxID=181172 RepID=A0ABR3Q5M9_9TREE
MIFAGIMYAANASIKIEYIDCLFMCYSCMCVTGLNTVNLSTLSTFQQFLLYFQMLIGSSIFVSIIMVSVRKHFFRVKFRHVLKERQKRRGSFSLHKTLTKIPTAAVGGLRRRFTRQPGADNVEEEDKPPSRPASVKKKKLANINKDMIKRIDGGGVGLVNPMGWYEAATPHPTPGTSGSRAATPDTNAETSPPQSPRMLRRAYSAADPEALKLSLERAARRDSAGTAESSKPSSGAQSTTDMSKDSAIVKEAPETESPTGYQYGEPLRQTSTNDSAPNGSAPRPYASRPLTEEAFPRSKTIAFDEPDDGFDHELHPSDGPYFPHTATARSGPGFPRTMTSGSNGGFPRTHSLRPTQSRFVDTKHSGFGGFPTPLEIVGDAVERIFPRTKTKVDRSLTMPRTNTIVGRDSIAPDDGAKQVNYISFSAVVGRNSRFQDLTSDQMDELGGVEYRALKVLFWIVLVYWVSLPLMGATIIAPYIAAGNRYDHVFDDQPKHVRIPWFAFFQATSAFSNTGVSLVDLSMVPFQRAYLMSVVLALLILFGNTCFPILLRFIIWTFYKMSPKNSSLEETLQFLLHHPRRCFIYLFPSTHTWFLVFVVIILTMIDWFSFMVLDKGNEVIDRIPIGTRLAAGLFQSAAVRAAGFAIVPLNALAPAVKVLYVIMMYISVYPIAMSVRATNVYEERSLGLFEGEEEEEEPEENDEEGAHAVAKYLGWHARRQLAFDMWWIVLALWLICIIERHALLEKENWDFMNVFNIIFEVVSAYGTVGLSLGVSYDNYALSGGFRKLSKLVICIVMLRGRHRGLPVAIDRAVMLPNDFTQEEETALEDRLRRSRSRRASTYAGSQTGSQFQTGSNFAPQPSFQLPRTFTAATEAPTGTQREIPRPTRSDSAPSSSQPVVFAAPAKRDTSPTAPLGMRRHQRTSSSGSASIEQPQPPTPSSLTFALGSRPSQTANMPPVAGGGGAAGTLTPVEEMSRRPTLIEEDPQVAAARAAFAAKSTEKEHQD